MIQEPPMTPPPAPPDRKGLSPLAWTGIGCGALAIVAIVGVAFAIGIFVKKAKELTENPATIAEFILNQSPDVEVVERDDQAETLTIRNKKSGEEITVNYRDITNGNLSIISENGEVNFDFAQENGSLTVETPDGTAVIGTGVPLADLPDWVPLYPGAEPLASSIVRSAKGTASGNVVMTTPDAASEVAEWQRQKLAAAGFAVTTNNTPSATVVQGKSQTNSQSVNSSITSNNGTTTMTINFGD